MSFLSRLNPVPQFPAYTGPYDVGSFELEIPASSLGEGPPPDVRIETVQFRVFYPTDKMTSTSNARGGWFGRGARPAPKPVRWLPEPYQREYLSGYARFMGVNSGFAEIVSYGLSPSNTQPPFFYCIFLLALFFSHFLTCVGN
jgi:platelet-activating factor acetylhydrolase